MLISQQTPSVFRCASAVETPIISVGSFPMKYILTFLLFTFLSCSLPQKISWDRSKEGNVRHIGSKALETKIDNATYSFNLTVFSRPTSKYYCLLISSLWTIENNSLVLIKLGNDETVKLVSDNANVGEIDWPTYLPIIGGTSTSGVMTTKKIDYYTSIYLLEDDILSKIEHYGIFKIRIQFGNKYKEQIWKRDKLGKFISKSHELLELQLQKPVATSKSIEQDF